MITIIVEGILRRENGAILEAHSTVTAISGSSGTVIVDTSSYSYRPKLLAGLENAGIAAEDVTAVILTHTHEDHTANLSLFPNAQIFIHPLEKASFEFIPVSEGDEIFSGVRIMHTPGHTLGSISVLVEKEKCIIAGDAVPTEANLIKNVPPGICADKKKAVTSMQRIISSADYIVPGHGRLINLSNLR